MAQSEIVVVDVEVKDQVQEEGLGGFQVALQQAFWGEIPIPTGAADGAGLHKQLKGRLNIGQRGLRVGRGRVQVGALPGELIHQLDKHHAVAEIAPQVPW
jgi:hypothetical protein